MIDIIALIVVRVVSVVHSHCNCAHLDFGTFSWLLFLFPVSAIAKYCRRDGLAQQKRSFSQFQWLEVCSQGVGRVLFPLKVLVEAPSLPLPSSWGLLSISFGLTWLGDAALQSCDMQPSTG